MTVREIVRDWLKEHGYDGLCGASHEPCGCGIEDLMPCDGEQALQCKPGFRHPCIGHACPRACDAYDEYGGTDCYREDEPPEAEGRKP